MLDDPTSSLDNSVALKVIKAFVEDEFWKRRTVIVSVTSLQLLGYFDRVIFMDEGRIIHFDSPENIVKKEDFIMMSNNFKEVEGLKVVRIGG